MAKEISEIARIMLPALHNCWYKRIGQYPVVDSALRRWQHWSSYPQGDIDTSEFDPRITDIIDTDFDVREIREMNFENLLSYPMYYKVVKAENGNMTNTLFANYPARTQYSDAWGDIFKAWIFCSLEDANRTRTGRNKISKQELYAFLFCAGLPMGMIAKTLLGSINNLGGVRNAIIAHKNYIRYWVEHEQCKLDDTRRGLANAIVRTRPENTQPIFSPSTHEPDWGKFFLGDRSEDFEHFRLIITNNFVRNMIQYCASVGGGNLYNKIVNGEDQARFAAEYELNDFRWVAILWGNQITARNVRQRVGWGINLKLVQATGQSDLAAGRTRGTRTTSSNLSRNATPQQVRAAATQTRRIVINRVEERPASPQPVSTQVLSTPSEQVAATQRTAAPRVKVRDLPFTNTFGVEIEGNFVDDTYTIEGKGMREIITALQKKLDDSGFVQDRISGSGAKRGENKPKLYSAYEEREDAGWKYHNDPSVHGGQSQEFASTILKGKNGIEAVKVFTSSLRQLGFFGNSTAGIHIHMGAKDLTLQHLKNLCYNFTKFEPLLDMIQPADRRWSNAFYAKSLSSIDDWERKIDQAPDFQRLMYALNPSQKYYAVNIHAYYSKGTIEFRKIASTNDDRAIIFWIYYLNNLWNVSARKKLTRFNIKGLHDILPAWAYSWFLDRVRQVSGYDIKYGYDVGAGGPTANKTNTYSRGGDPMQSPVTDPRMRPQDYRSRGKAYGKDRRNNDFS